MSFYLFDVRESRGSSFGDANVHDEVRCCCQAHDL
jgi:hypothetical protein